MVLVFSAVRARVRVRVSIRVRVRVRVRVGVMVRTTARNAINETEKGLAGVWADVSMLAAGGWLQTRGRASGINRGRGGRMLAVVRIHTSMRGRGKMVCVCVRVFLTRGSLRAIAPAAPLSTRVRCSVGVGRCLGVNSSLSIDSRPGTLDYERFRVRLLKS